MDIAKVIRNTQLSLANRVSVGGALADYFATMDQFFDRSVFLGIVKGTTLDKKTNAYSDIED